MSIGCSAIYVRLPETHVADSVFVVPPVMGFADVQPRIGHSGGADMVPSLLLLLVSVTLVVRSC